MVFNVVAPASGLHAVGYSTLAWNFGASIWMLWGVLTYSRLIVHPLGFVGFIVIAALVVLVTSVACWQRIRLNQIKMIPRQALFNVLISLTISAYLAVNFKLVHGVEIFFVPTDSMAPAIQVGEVVIADTTEAAIKNVRLGDIVAFQHDKLGGDDIWIKRISDVTGNTVSMAGDNVSTSVSAHYLRNIPKADIQGVVKAVLGSYSRGDYSLSIRQIE